MCDILKGKLHSEFSRFTCDVCGQQDEGDNVPFFTVDSADLAICDSCLLAGSDKIAKTMDAHIRELAEELQSCIEGRKRHLSRLKKAQACTWEFPAIDDVRQARLQYGIDIIGEMSGSPQDMAEAQQYGEAIAEVGAQWSVWPEISGRDFQAKLHRTKKPESGDEFDDHPF